MVKIKTKNGFKYTMTLSELRVYIEQIQIEHGDMPIIIKIPVWDRDDDREYVILNQSDTSEIVYMNGNMLMLNRLRTSL